MLKKWYHKGGYIISVCVVGSEYSTFKLKSKMKSFTTLLLHFMLNTLNNKKILTRILDHIKYMVLHYLSYSSTHR